MPAAKGWISALAALLLCACGSPASFTAEEFVDEANAHGARLTLGTKLPSEREDVSVYALDVGEAEESSEEPHDGDAGHAHGGGSLAVLEDADAGLSEFERCEQGVSLVCFRAANIVLIFGGTLTPDQQADLGAALEGMAS